MTFPDVVVWKCHFSFPLCKYKMIVTKNNTSVERSCIGYRAYNDGGGFYSSFKVVLFQPYALSEPS